MRKIFTYISVMTLVAVLLVSSIVPGFAVSNEIDFKTHTDTLYLLNLDTNTVVYNKGGSEKRYPASTAKIMTYVVVLEQVADVENTKVTIKQDVLDLLEGTGSSLSGLKDKVGKQLTVHELLYYMMVSSGNDAALILADFVSGGDMNKFVELMNTKAEKLGCKDTHFTNAHGLHDKNQYTTAVDLAKITKHALTQKYFTEICNTVSYDTGVEDESPLVSTNLLINPNEENYYYEYAKGLKTGTTDEAGRCLVSTALKDNTAYLCIALHAPCYDKDGAALEENYAMKDTKSLYEWAFKNIEMKSIVGAQTNVCDVKINYASGRDNLMLTPEYGYSTMLPKNLDENAIEIKTQCPEVIDAPVQKGDIIGTATISYNGEELTKINLVASEAMERSEFIYAMTIVKNIISSPAFLGALVVIVLLFIAYMVFVSRYNKNKDKNVKKHREM